MTASQVMPPGVYVQEISTGRKPISAASTTITAFIGNAPKKDAFVNEPTPCNNFEDFSRKFMPQDMGPADDLALAHAVYGFFVNGGTYCYIVNVAGQGIAGDPARKTGVHSLSSYDDISLLAAPGRTDQADHEALIDYCESKGNCFAILDGPEKFDDIAELTTIATDSVSSDPAGSRIKGKRARATSYAAQYVPHLVMKSPFTNKREHVAPSGHLAGIYARTDMERGVHKAPANVGMRACIGLTQRITSQEQGMLNESNVNCIRYFPSSGIRVWGARTLSTDNSEWRYINVRRLFLMIEESMRRNTSWTVFEPNDTMLRKSLIRDVSAFLKLLWLSGALVGSSPSEAFFVKCDGENNPQESVDAGRLIVDIGLAPSKPAEFIIFRIGQWQGGVEVEETE